MKNQQRQLKAAKDVIEVAQREGTAIYNVLSDRKKSRNRKLIAYAAEAAMKIATTAEVWLPS